MAYSKIHETFWDDPVVRGLSEQARYLMLYLITCRHRNRLGCYVLDQHYIAADLGWDVENARERIQELCDADRIAYDWPTRVLLVRHYVRHNTLENAKVVTGASAELRAVPDTELLRDLLESLAKDARPHYDPIIKELRNRIANRLPNGSGIGNPNRGPTLSVALPVTQTRTDTVASPPADEPPQLDSPDQPAGAAVASLHARRSEAAGIVRQVYWQGDEPPPKILRKYPDWSMGRELDTWNKLVAGHEGEFTPEEINAGLEVVREIHDWGPDPPLSLLLFNVEGRRDRLRLCIEHAQQKAVEQQPDEKVAGTIGDIMREAAGGNGSGKPVESRGGNQRARRHAHRPRSAGQRARASPG